MAGRDEEPKPMDEFRERRASLKEKERKVAEKQRFLEQPLVLDDLKRQSASRVQFMKSRRSKFYTGADPEWDIPRRAENLLSRFKYHHEAMRMAEGQYEHAVLMQVSPKIKADLLEKMDGHAKECLFVWYGIGMLYSRFTEIKG